MTCIPIVLALLAAEPLGPGDHLRRLDVDGQSRSYWVHVPPQYRTEVPRPLVLAFHGAGMNGKLMSQWSGLNETADQQDFLVVYPNGTGIADLILTFNVGQGRADEVKFVQALLEDTAAVLSFDAPTGLRHGLFQRRHALLPAGRQDRRPDRRHRARGSHHDHR